MNLLLSTFNPFDRKLFRDLWLVKGQVFAITLVISIGVATYVLSVATSDSLQRSQEKFYRDYHFAHIFIDLKRAPMSIVSQLADYPGVNQVQARISQGARITIEGFNETVTARLLSLPNYGKAKLNQLYLRQGRLPRENSRDEVVVSDAFFKAQQLKLNDSIYALVNGVYRQFTIVGVALSPEYIYQLSPGQFIPDDKRFALLWLPYRLLASAYNMQGATNNISLSLAPGVDRKELVKRLDLDLAKYGSLGAITRDDQISNRYLSEEFKQLKQMAIIYPAIFLSVAIFLLNIVISRIISSQREQIGTLKAFGYSHFEIGLHYIKFVSFIVIIGLIIGLALGVWLGYGMSQMYAEYYRFPKLVYAPPTQVYIVAILMNLGAAYLGSWLAVRKSVKLTPTEAMRPEPPSNYRHTLIDSPLISRFFSRLSRMIVRNLSSRPIKSSLTVVGIALSFAIMVVGNYFVAALDQMLKVQYLWNQQEDLTISYIENTSQRGLSTIKNINGVNYVEPFRILAVKMRHHHNAVKTSIHAIAKDSRMKFLLDTKQHRFSPPDSGIILTQYLADMLKVKPGDNIEIQLLEGRRQQRQLRVVATITEYVGISGYMSLTAANQLAGDYRLMNGSYLLIEKSKYDQVLYQLRNIPAIVAVSDRRQLIRNFLDTLGNTVLTFVGFMIVFAGTITFGVVYNSARISLSERSRDLASMRVLGFTRAEISYILLGEQAILTLAALPIGCAFGYILTYILATGLQNELYRMPIFFDTYTYSLAATAVIISALISGLIVRRKLDQLDMVAVLKTRE